jgi:hypothetical protein
MGNIRRELDGYCPTKSGVMKSMVKPIPYKMNRKGGGTNNETTQIAADNAKPIEYFLSRVEQGEYAVRYEYTR